MPDPRKPRSGSALQPPLSQAVRRGDPSRRFPGELEDEFERTDLADHRGLIRTMCTCGAVIVLWHAAEQILAGRTGRVLFAELGAIVACSVALAVLAWSPIFERRYRSWASVLVPLRDLIAVVHLVEVAAHDSPVVLMALPFMVLAAFFLLGLRLRVALLCAALCLAAFAISAAHYALAPTVMLRGCLFLAVTIAGSAIGRWQLDRRARASFLERGMISEMAQRDSLTGTLNRRMFDEQLARSWQEAAAKHRSLAIILIDVDHFKAYNDRYGHLAGDEALRRVARAIQAAVRRPSDQLARYGGEEFGVIVCQSTATETRALAERMRRSVMDLRIEHSGSPSADVLTISLGAATVEPTLLREHRGALQLADQALYQAKVRGRNCVELLDESQYRLLVTGVFSTPGPLAQKPLSRRARQASA